MTTRLQQNLQLCLYAAILIVPVCTGAIVGTSQWSSGKDHTAHMLAPSPVVAVAVAAGKGVCLILTFALLFSDPPGMFKHNRGESPISYYVWLTLIGFEAFDAVRNIIAMQQLSTCFSLLPIFVLLPLSTARSLPYSVVYNAFKTFVNSMSLLTTALVVLFPETVLAPYGSGILPGFPFRLNGFFCAANPFGSILAFYLLIPAPPSDERRQKFLVWASKANILILLALTQSKASIVSFVLGIAVYAIYRIMQVMDFNLRMLFLTLCIVIGSLGFFAKDTVVETLLSRTDFKASDAATLTGRTKLWEIVLEEWKVKPLFGYGSQKWINAATDFNYRGPSGEIEILGHAHNQLIHTLWGDGICGAFFLLLHLFCLIAAALSAEVRLRPGLFSAIFVLIVGGCTEQVIPTAVGDYLSISYISIVLLVSTASYANSNLKILPWE